MAKKAFIVVSTLLTRVVVDEDLENESNWDELVEKAKEGILTKLRNDELSENIEDVLEDTDCPYDPRN